MQALRLVAQMQMVSHLLGLACAASMPSVAFAVDMMAVSPETLRSGALERPIALPTGNSSPAINRFAWVPLTGGKTDTLVVEVDSAEACPEMLVPTLRLTGFDRPCNRPIYDPDTRQFVQRFQFAAAHGLPSDMTCREALSVNGAIVFLGNHIFGGCLRIPSPLPDILRRDSDGDGTPDHLDAFPQDSGETTDTDRDGLGNNIDPDDDNDGIPDHLDAFPTDQTEWADTDRDGIGNNADADDDNDTVADDIDNCPLTANPDQIDGDGDGVGDACDLSAASGEDGDGWWYLRPKRRPVE